MLKIGLTGGIGSGKTTAAHLFADLGVPIIDADVVAREVVAANAEVLPQIAQHFGPLVLDLAGKLNRQYLRKQIFEQPAERRWLEALLHPLIIHEMVHQVSLVTAPYCVLVIPLLIESESDLPQGFIDRVLVIDSPEDKQIARTQQRDKLSAAEVGRILASQATREQRLKRADDVIVNDGDKVALEKAVVEKDLYYRGLMGY
jgi:dephospho-CoA kinase